MSTTQRSSLQIDMPHDNKSRPSKYARFNEQKRSVVIFWCEIAVFILGATSCILSFSVQALKRTSIRGFAMWQLCLLITALLCGPVLSKAISNLILFCIKSEFSSKGNLMYYIVGLVKSAWVVLWFSLILLAWNLVIDEPSFLGVPQENKDKMLRKFASTEHDITLTLITLILGSFLWLLKDLLIMIGKSSFHIRRFFDRIRESLIHEYRIETFSNRNPRSESMPPKLFTCEEKNVCGKKKEIDVDLSSLERVDQDIVSCWTMKTLINDIVKERPLVFYNIHEGMEKLDMIDKEQAIDNATNIIYSNLDPLDGAQHLESKLSRYFNEEEVHEVSQWLLEGAETKQINEEGIRKCLTRAWKYRTSLVRALQDNKILFRDLNRFVDVVLVIIIFLVWLVMLNVEIRRAMVVVGSIIVGSAVFLGDLSKKLLDDFTFVFLVHPFDVGDSCLIDNTLVTIEKIKLLTTRASTLEDEMRFYPNSLLCGLPIINYTRSPPRMGDSVLFSLDIINTSPSIIFDLKGKISSYIGDKSNYWHQDHELVMEFDPQDSTKLKATLHVKHAIKYHDYKERQTRKSQLTSELLKYLQELKLLPDPSTPQDPTPSNFKDVNLN